MCPVLNDMAVKSSIKLQSIKDSEEFLAKRTRIMNTPPDEVDERQDFSDLLKRSVDPNGQDSITEASLSASWERLLRQIKEEIKIITQTGPKTIPEIDFEDISKSKIADAFLRDLKIRGVAIIRNVIPVDEAATWSYELDSYLRDNPHTKASPPENPELYELFWSLAQLNARAHPNMLAAQKFAMSGCWHHHHRHDQQSTTSLSCNFPVTYADRLRMLRKGFRGSSLSLDVRKAMPSRPCSARLGTDGDGQREVNEHNVQHSTRTSIYQEIWSGKWEAYDPWDTSIRASRTGEDQNYSNTSRAFKMFQGIVPLTAGSSDDDPPMRMCSLPLKLTIAYSLLRPLFCPQRPLKEEKKREAFLDPRNWQRSASRVGEPPSPPRNLDDTFYPHLQLEQTLIDLPPLHPGDYMIWHPDTIYAPPSSTSPTELDTPFSSSPATSSSRGSITTPPPSPSTILYIPACPLTLNNAEYLVHQRRAFLLGYPGPDFTSTPTHNGPTKTNDEHHTEIGESYHMGRPGVQEINDAGGEEALRAMGLLAWDEDDAADAGERALLKMANSLLFP